MRKYMALMVVILFGGVSKSEAQLIENDSLLTINQDFDFSIVNDQYYLTPKFNSKCLKKGVKFEYDYFRGVLQGEIPIQYYVKAFPKFEKKEYSVSSLDSLITIYFIGSKTSKYFEVKVEKNSSDIVIIFYSPTGSVCETKKYPKAIFQKLITENHIVSPAPPYDRYSRITLIKNFH